MSRLLAAFWLIVGLTLLGLALLPGPSPGASRQCGVASWYGAESGRRTANGERFPTREATAAHKTLPFGTHVRVTDMATGRSVVVRLNDRGPAKWTHRIIDLSPAAARALGGKGLWRVCLTVLR